LETSLSPRPFRIAGRPGARRLPCPRRGTLRVGQIDAHTDGDSWDYLVVSPDLSKEQTAKVDDASRKHGRKTGFASNLEFRTFVASHTDTFAIGPVSAADLVAMAK